MADSNISQNELAGEFMKNFTNKKESLKDQIDKLSSESTSNMDCQLSNISSEIQQMSKSLHDAVMFLPSYSVKIRQNEIRDLERMLREKEDALVPKKKFGFKSKFKPSNAEVPKRLSEPTSTEELHDIGANNLRGKEALNASNYFTIDNLQHQTVRYGEKELNNNDVLVKDITDSVIILAGGPSTLRLVNLQRCKLLCGPVRTSVFIDNVSDSTLYVCCQQLRTHSSERVDIYLRVASRAIIEDCSKVRFGPYEWDHEKSKELHENAEIDSNLERYDAVDDFNWLSATQSPNWSIIPDSDRKAFNENLEL